MTTNTALAPESAERHAVKRVPTGCADDTAGLIRDALVGQAFDCTDAVYVLDEGHRLKGLVPFPELLEASADRKLHELMITNPPYVHSTEDQERVAMHALAHGLASIPVIDDDGRLLGVVPGKALIEILRHEHTEDLHKLAGIVHQNHRVHEAMTAAPTRRLRVRLPWLLVGLAGSTVATFLMARYEEVLQRRVAIAFFIPAIVYLADAIGTQTEAIAVRFLTLSRAPLGRLLFGELVTGALIGLSLAVLVFPGVMLGFGDARLAIAVTLAVIAAGICATGIGLVLPWVLARIGKDPAFGSGPVATIIQDVLSLLIYFVIVGWLAV